MANNFVIFLKTLDFLKYVLCFRNICPCFVSFVDYFGEKIWKKRNSIFLIGGQSFECQTWYSNLERTLGTSLLLLVLAHNNILHSAIKHNISFLVKKESDQNQIWKYFSIKIYQELKVCFIQKMLSKFGISNHMNQILFQTFNSCE